MIFWGILVLCSYINIGVSPACAGRSNGRHMWHVYILKSQIRNWYYVGSTNDLNRRLLEHNTKKVTSTKSYTPFVIFWTKEFLDEKSCRMYEKMLKDKRREKESIIRNVLSKQ